MSWSLLPLVVFAVVLTAFSALPAAAVGLPASTVAAPSVVHAAALPTGTTTTVNSAGLAKTGVTPNPVENRILSSLQASHAPMNEVFLPNFNSRASVSDGVVHPLYSTSPAPMGLGDFGIQNVNGTNVGTISYTQSVKAALTLNAVDPLYLGAAGPDQFTIQENTVLTHVDVFGNSSNDDYWIQNVPVYYASSHLLVFEDNIWNFSNPAFFFPPNGIAAHGPASFFIDDEVYIGIGTVSYNIAPPFTITTYNNATVYNDRPTVFFNYTLTKDGRSVSGSYDFAEFNSTGGAPPTSPAPMPSYQINGQAFNPTGFLLNDAEIMLGGPGGGSTTTLWNIAGSFGLWTLPNGTSTYKDVPSAYDFGTDTGETSEGIAEHSSGGPNPVAVIDSGPSILYPLWGIAGSVPMGAVQQTLHITPSNAFVFVSRDRPFNESIAAWAPVPTSGTATYWLPPGTYSYEVLLSEHSPSSFALTGNVLSQTVTLPLNTALGVYTPLYAFGNGQLAAISQAGVGTVKDPYVLYNNQVGPISSLFDEFNDYLFPVFPGILLVNTTDFVSVWDAPSFFFTYGTFPEQATVVAEGLPLSNYLEYNFYGVTHVSITDTPLITGWIFADDVGFTEASVVFWNSSYNLIAGNSFQVMSQAMILFGGSHNTIWGNLFNPISAGAPNPGAIGLAGSQFAITMWESQDMTYNNAFLTPVTAYTPTVNIYNGAPALYMDHWNVPRQPASDVRSVNGWLLTGSIIGTSYQGGNYWWNYGTQTDPYGVLPYNEGGAISWQGDYVPLIPFSLYEVTFTESGLHSGTVWSVTLNGITEYSNIKTIHFWDPNGTYAYTVAPIAGMVAHPSSGAVTVNGTPVAVSIVWTT
ncbi:MAG: thermopsin family protease [Thermoplasmata archaeon]